VTSPSQYPPRGNHRRSFCTKQPGIGPGARHDPKSLISKYFGCDGGFHEGRIGIARGYAVACSGAAGAGFPGWARNKSASLAAMLSTSPKSSAPHSIATGIGTVTLRPQPNPIWAIACQQFKIPPCFEIQPLLHSHCFSVIPRSLFDTWPGAERKGCASSQEQWLRLPVSPLFRLTGLSSLITRFERGSALGAEGRTKC
jgi:hypothetical protein